MIALAYVTVMLVMLPALQAYNILLTVPFNGPSHWLFLQHFVRELDSRGHSVTCITNMPLTGKISSNYTEILIDPPFDLQNIISHEAVFESSFKSDTANIHMLRDLGIFTSDYGLRDPKVQKIIHSNNLHFDLVLAEQFFQESWLLFAHKFNAPIVTICTYGISDFLDRAMGLLTPWSHVPHMLLSYKDDMTFQQRLYNVYLSTYDYIHRKWIYLPAQNKQAQKFFGHLEKNGEPLPSVEELENKISVIFINSHRSIAAPRPAMPGVINVGGAHIKPPKPLPDDIQKYLDGAKNGVIYFSLGAYMKSSSMPKEKISIFLDTFSKLKQNVLWKFEDESLQNIPPNVMIRKWMPQSDILAHKNVVLFMSHGGMFGNFEGIDRGVPMLFIPLYGDQYRNAQRAEATGYGQTIKFSEVTRESLFEKITELTATKKYYNRAKELSALFRDNPIQPLDEAMFWIEYVCRHKGAKHLKSHAVNMPWYSYLLFDVIGVVLVALITVYLALWKIFKLLLGKSKVTKGDNAKRKKKN